LILENLINQLVSPVIVPEILTAKLYIFQTYKLNENEILLLNHAIMALHNRFIIENKTDLMRVNLIFTETGQVTMSMNQDQLGSHVCMCIYAVGVWRQKGYDDRNVLTILLEELCHHFWAIEDEDLVTFKVLEVMQTLNPTIPMNLLYRPR